MTNHPPPYWLLWLHLLCHIYNDKREMQGYQGHCLTDPFFFGHTEHYFTRG